MKITRGFSALSFRATREETRKDFETGRQKEDNRPVRSRYVYSAEIARYNCSKNKRAEILSIAAANISQIFFR